MEIDMSRLVALFERREMLFWSKEHWFHFGPFLLIRQPCPASVTHHKLGQMEVFFRNHEVLKPSLGSKDKMQPSIGGEGNEIMLVVTG